MMIYHKMPMSGVYENVFQTSEISILPSLSNELLFTLCLRTPSNGDQELNLTFFSFHTEEGGTKVNLKKFPIRLYFRINVRTSL